MDPEYEVIVLFISTTKWSIKVISIDRRTPPNTNTTVYIMQITSLPFILIIRSLRYESIGVYARGLRNHDVRRKYSRQRGARFEIARFS